MAEEDRVGTVVGWLVRRLSRRTSTDRRPQAGLCAKFTARSKLPVLSLYCCRLAPIDRDESVCRLSMSIPERTPGARAFPRLSSMRDGATVRVERCVQTYKRRSRSTAASPGDGSTARQSYNSSICFPLSLDKQNTKLFQLPTAHDPREVRDEGEANADDLLYVTSHVPAGQGLRSSFLAAVQSIARF